MWSPAPLPSAERGEPPLAALPEGPAGCSPVAQRKLLAHEPLEGRSLWQSFSDLLLSPPTPNAEELVYERVPDCAILALGAMTPLQWKALAMPVLRLGPVPTLSAPTETHSKVVPTAVESPVAAARRIQSRSGYSDLGAKLIAHF